MTYPCMLYHPQFGAVVVQDAADHAGLSPLWTRIPPADSISVSPTVIPLHAVPPEPVIAPEAPSDIAPPPEAILVAEPDAPKRKPGRPKKDA